jgi:hypothetical protein
VVEVEKFDSSGTRVLGVIGVASAFLIAAVVATDGLEGSDDVLFCVIGFLGVLMWSAMVRPQVRLDGDRLFLREMLGTVSFPVAAVEAVEVRQVLVLRAGGRKFTSAAVSKSVSQVRKDQRGVARDEKLYPNFVEDRIRSRSEDERARAGLSRGEVPLDLHRAVAWPEIALMVLFGVGAVILLLV